MIYILIVILTSASFNILFKIFQRLGINTTQAIIINYVVAVSITFISAPKALLHPSNLITEGWFYGGLALGALFYYSMLLYAQTTKNFGIAITTLMTRMSLIFPTLVAFLFLGESISTRGWIGIALIMGALYLLVANKDNKLIKGSLKWYIALLPLLVFILCGANDTLIKIILHNYVSGEGENSAFTFFVYITSLTIGLISYLSQKSNRKIPISIKTVIGGSVMGVINVINVFALLKALGQVPASVVFPTNNIGIVMVSVLVGVIVFKEPLTKRRILGILLAIAAIYLLH